MTRPEQDSGGSLQIALLGAGAAVVVALVTGAFALLSNGDSAPRPAPITATGGHSRNNASCVSGGVIVQGTVNCAPVAKHPSGQLRVAILPAAPDVFHVAFAKDIGTPAENMGWQELHDRGGVDVNVALSRVTLANRSEKPVTVRDIHIEVSKSGPAPRDSLAYVFAQGDGPLSQFAALITTTAPGARSDLYKVVDDQPGWLRNPADRPFFERNYLSLRPGEIYESTVTVQASVTTPRLVSFRFVISGSTPERDFTIRHSAASRLSIVPDTADSRGYSHYYVRGFLAFLRSAGCRSSEVKKWYAEPAGSHRVNSRCPDDLH
jgi:hypothetical protein